MVTTSGGEGHDAAGTGSAATVNLQLLLLVLAAALLLVMGYVVLDLPDQVELARGRFAATSVSR